MDILRCIAQITQQVRSGPVYDTDRIETTGNATYPVWISSQKDMYENAAIGPDGRPQPTRSNISLSGALPPNSTHTATRVVGCIVIGEDPRTKLPVTIYAASKIVLNGHFPWVDFSYPISTRPCLGMGCIFTVAHNLDKPGLLAHGRAASLGDKEALFVRVENARGIVQVVPPVRNETHDLTEAVYRDLAGLIEPSQFQNVTSWQVSSSGHLYTTGLAYGGGFLAVSEWFPSVQGGSYLVQMELKPPSWTAVASCLSTPAFPSGMIFGNLTSSWLDPRSGELFVADTTCGKIFGVSAETLSPACWMIYCGQIRPFANLTAAGYTTGAQATMVGDSARGVLYVASSCGVVSFSLTTGAFLEWIVGVPKFGGGYQGRCGSGGDGGPALDIRVGLSPHIGQMDVDPDTGDLYIAETDSHRIRHWTRATRKISTIAGNGSPGYAGDGGQAVNALLDRPKGLKIVKVQDVTAAGGFRRILYITEADRLRKVLLN